MADIENRRSEHPLAPRVLTNSDIQAARDKATTAHHGQTDKAGADYIDHPARVVGHLVRPTKEQSIVAWLHDVVEDTSVSLGEIELAFGPLVAAGVDAMTHRQDETNLDYYARVNANPIARTSRPPTSPTTPTPRG